MVRGPREEEYVGGGAKSGWDPVTAGERFQAASGKSRVPSSTKWGKEEVKFTESCVSNMDTCRGQELLQISDHKYLMGTEKCH